MSNTQYQTVAGTVQGKLTRWGNSLGLRIPTQVRDAAHLSCGDNVVMRVEGNSVVITPVITRSRFPFSEKQLIAGLTPEAHEELLPVLQESEYTYEYTLHP